MLISTKVLQLLSQQHFGLFYALRTSLSNLCCNFIWSVTSLTVAPECLLFAIMPLTVHRGHPITVPCWISASSLEWPTLSQVFVKADCKAFVYLGLGSRGKKPKQRSPDLPLKTPKFKDSEVWTNTLVLSTNICHGSGSLTQCFVFLIMFISSDSGLF